MVRPLLAVRLKLNTSKSSWREVLVTRHWRPFFIYFCGTKKNNEDWHDLKRKLLCLACLQYLYVRNAKMYRELAVALCYFYS
jgi:hypothetical protein